MVAGQVSQRGVAVRPAFARETSAFEQEPAPIPYQVTGELGAQEKMRSCYIVWVSIRCKIAVFLSEKYQEKN